jgi:hypothetical protein
MPQIVGKPNIQPNSTRRRLSKRTGGGSQEVEHEDGGDEDPRKVDEQGQPRTLRLIDGRREAAEVVSESHKPEELHHAEQRSTLEFRGVSGALNEEEETAGETDDHHDENQHESEEVCAHEQQTKIKA